MQPALQFGAWERGKGLVGGSINNIAVFQRNLTQVEVRQLAAPSLNTELIGKRPQQLDPQEKRLLKELYLATASPDYRASLVELQKVRAKLNDSTENIPELPIMQEMPKPRITRVLDRGQYDAYKEKVFPGVPPNILPMPKNLPANRLGFAKWLIHPDHPLTARVAVNRFWMMYFGNGLVKTAEDFGNQGELPSHPELLDWLSVTFRESGWNVKALQKMIVMSATYRQRSIPTKQTLEKDPENILLSYGPANRLTAEMLRDNALAASGLLHLRIGGRSVNPYQPEGLWKINGSEYVQDTGANLYRRGLYTVWRRSAPNPTQATFDVGIRTSCVVGRQKTNTPLQALITLNDPVFVEASKVIGERITRAADGKVGITEAFRTITGRKPTPAEIGLLTQLQNQEYKKFKSHPLKAKGWLEAGSYKTTSSLDQAMVAANAVVANTILNTDAAITKR
jgi:hypothetical protein